MLMLAVKDGLRWSSIKMTDRFKAEAEKARHLVTRKTPAPDGGKEGGIDED
jgi:hypothetical protein